MATDDVELTHASFFSGVGGLDLGLERAGWRTVSFSEIDPYASVVLVERWSGVPNLGDITSLRARLGDGRELDGAGNAERAASGSRPEPGDARPAGDWQHATLWSGGFPCQDLSVAGKRAGFAGERSSLAFAFLGLVERHRPPAILLENVPGLLSSHGGRDFGRLLGEMGQLGYGWAYRILDARHFGVPQRRRRVFIVGLHAGTGLGADSAAAVLSVGTRCGGHPATGHATGEGATERTTVGALPAGQHGFPDGVQEFMQGHFRVQPQYSASPDAGGVRAADGLAGRLDDSHQLVHAGQNDGQLARALSSVGGGNDYGANKGNLAVFTKRARVSGPDTPESWKEGGVMPTLNSFDVGDTRTTGIILGDGPADDPLLPLGLDSHRYRCCGNGVVSSVAEWIGLRLAQVMA